MPARDHLAQDNGEGMSDRMLTAHFTAAEFEHTSTGLPNSLPPEMRDNAVFICSELLEPWRLKVGAIYINSGFRSPAVNKAVSGVPTSAHMLAMAADSVPLHVSLFAAFEILIGLNLPALDQAILYPYSGFIHVGGRKKDARHQHLVCNDPTRKAKLISWEEFKQAQGGGSHGR